jgi:hypothetical protein
MIFLISAAALRLFRVLKILPSPPSMAGTTQSRPVSRLIIAVFNTRHSLPKRGTVVPLLSERVCTTRSRETKCPRLISLFLAS